MTTLSLTIRPSASFPGASEALVGKTIFAVGKDISRAIAIRTAEQYPQHDVGLTVD
jgi:hypothetical protein